MAIFMLVSDGVKTAILLDNKSIGNGVEQVSFSSRAAEDTQIDIKISSLHNFKFGEKEQFFELAKSIAGVEIKDVTAPL